MNRWQPDRYIDRALVHIETGVRFVVAVAKDCLAAEGERVLGDFHVTKVIAVIARCDAEASEARRILHERRARRDWNFENAALR